MSGDELRRWLDAADGEVGPTAGDDPSGRPVRRWWLAAVVAPWVLLAVAFVGGGGAAPTTGAGGRQATPSTSGAPALPRATEGAAAAVDPATPEPGPADPVPTAAGATAPDTAGGTGSGTAGTDPPEGVAPTAVGMVRDAVTTASGGRTSALDSATPEEPRPLGGRAWLVRVHAVVLRGDHRRWRSARHEVWAAPVGRRDGAVVALDRPWRVAITELDHGPPAWQGTTGDLAAVRRALRAAGLPTGPGLRLERDPAMPAVVRAVTASSTAWLRAGAHPRVLGTDTR